MKYLLIMTIGILTMLTGCREYRYYAFKRVDLNVWRGQLQIEVVGSYKDYSENNKKYQDWANPYALAFRYFHSNSERVDKIEVSDVVLTGLASGSKLTLGGAESSHKLDLAKWIDKKDQRIEMGTTISALKNMDLSYESYQLSCVVRLYADGKVLEEKKIEVKLETDFKKGKRSDAYDALMGI
ncbi:MAG: hypothetical protein KF897_11315 [Opitutaceae bacterium]|nr:hypothetical protein [Opitutaceae bacterium]